VGLYDSFATLVASDDDSGTGFDSVLNYQVQADGEYYAVVQGFGSGFASDPFTAGTGGGVGSTGEYDVAFTIAIETFADSLGTGLDTYVGLYDSFGTLLASDDDSGTGFDSVLNYQVQADGEYYAVVRGFGSGFASDPFTAGTGGGIGSIGEYDVTISVNSEALVFA